MTSFTTTTRILQGFAFLCKLTLLLFKPHWNYKRFKYEGKNEKDSDRSSKMTPSCKWPILDSYANLRREMNKNMNEPEQELSWILPTPLVFMHLSMVCPRMGIRLNEAHMGREFDILNVPRVGNLTQPPSWKVEDQGMTGKRSAILENTQQPLGWVSHILMCSFLCEGWQNETSWQKYFVP